MGVDARVATKFDNSHYLPFLEKYQNADMSGEPYILLIERIDVIQTEELRRIDAIEKNICAMKYSRLYLLWVVLAFVSCSGTKEKGYVSHESEVVDGMILVTPMACFFVPDGRCDYLDCDNSSAEQDSAVIIDYLERISDINTWNSIVAKIDMLPNMDTSDKIEWLEHHRYSFVNEGECFIVPAKVKLMTHYKPIRTLYYSYVLRFSWQNTVYNYVCIDKGGSLVDCTIISGNETMLDEIANKHSLPNGKERHNYKYGKNRESGQTK